LTVGAILHHAAISGPLSCEAAGGLPAMMSAQLVHHLGGEAGDGAVLPDAALGLEALAEPGDRGAVAARRPLRDEGDARLDLCAGRHGQRGRCSRTGQ
jgi:hypothetical protein